MKPQDGRTHWPECWRERGHHECAIALIEELTQDLNDARNGWEGAVEAARDMADTERVIAWIRDPNRKRAVTSFTEGPERQIAYAVEDVLSAPVEGDKPIPMVLFCPVCNTQHIDAPEPEKGWDNPPHKSHLCHKCGVVWRPCDLHTVGVLFIETLGKRDTWKPQPNPKQGEEG